MKAVLTYHSVDDSGSVISVTRAELARQLDDILGSGAKVVRFSEIHSLPADANAVAITFDDGFANFMDSAFPVLAERGIHATVFVVSDYVGTSNDWESADSRAEVPRLPLMGWPDLRSLGSEVEVGAHGMSHKSLKGQTPALLDKELSGCAQKMESELGAKPRTFAFPYGDVDKAAIAAVARHFSFACTTGFSLVTRDSLAHAIPRLDSFYFRNSSRLRRFGSAEFAAWVQVRRIARIARRSLPAPRLNG